MSWTAYAAIFRRRWLIVAAVLALDVIVSGYLYVKARRAVGYQACLTLYVADVSSPSLIAAAPTTLQTAGQLLAGETAANFFGDDILDTAQSGDVARFIGQRLASRGLPSSTEADIRGAVSGTRLDRTVNLCVANPDQRSALAIARQLGVAMTSYRARFVGRQMAHRTYVGLISTPTVTRGSTRAPLVTLLLRLVLGLFVALAAALVWDALDPNVRDGQDVERVLGVPVLA